MNKYEAGYGNRFGPPRRARVKPKMEKPQALEAPNVIVEVDPALDVADLNNVVADLNQDGVDTLAAELARDNTKTELKAIALEYGIEFKSNIRELELATLVATYEIMHGV